MMTNDKLERVALKPCPFCGMRSTYVEVSESKYPGLCVMCTACHAEGPACSSTEAAIAAWNTRAACEAEAGEPTEAMIASGRACLPPTVADWRAGSLVRAIYTAMRRAALNTTAGEGEAR